MASKRINIVPLTIEELEYLMGIPAGHHIENVVYRANRRVIDIHLSGDSMTEVPAGHEIPWVVRELGSPQDVADLERRSREALRSQLKRKEYYGDEEED